MNNYDFQNILLTYLDELIYVNKEISRKLNLLFKTENNICPFTYAELGILYDWASREHYFTKKYNQDLADSINNKLLKMLKKYEEEEEDERKEDIK